MTARGVQFLFRRIAGTRKLHVEISRKQVKDFRALCVEFALPINDESISYGDQTVAVLGKWLKR